MSSTEPVQVQNIEAYNSEGQFLGYVSKVYGAGMSVTCTIVDWKCQFSKKRASTILSAAKAASIYITPSGTKYYRQKEKFSFKMVSA